MKKAMKSGNKHVKVIRNPKKTPKEKSVGTNTKHRKIQNEKNDSNNLIWDTINAALPLGYKIPDPDFIDILQNTEKDRVGTDVIQ